MSRKSLVSSSVVDLAARYAEAVSEHWQSLDAANAKAANAQYKKIVATWKELRGRGQEGQEALLALMNHSHPYVRGWAATHVLEFCPARAEAALEKLAKGPPSLVRLDAEMTLAQWRDGSLRFDKS